MLLPTSGMSIGIVNEKMTNQMTSFYLCANVLHVLWVKVGHEGPKILLNIAKINQQDENLNFNEEYSIFLDHSFDS